MSPAEPPAEPLAESAVDPLAVRALKAFGRVLLRVPRPIGFLPPLLWACAIFFGSSQPAPKVSVPGFAGGLLENSAHAVEYGILAALLCLCARRTSGWVVLDRKTVAWIVALIAVYASSDEWHQSFVPHRDASVYDVITDIMGAISTLACIDALSKSQRSGRILARRCLVGFAICIAAATLATLEPW
jgi:VanZ like protein